MARRVLSTSLVALALAGGFAGCGGDDFETFSPDEVRTRVRELTGVTPIVSGYEDPGTTALSFAIPRPDTGLLQERYGGTRITVFSDEDDLRRDVDDAGDAPVRVVRNVVVQGTGRPEGAAGFRRVVTIVRSLDDPASAARIRPQDLPCARVGIDPDGGTGRTGTCLSGAQAVTVVAADGELRLDDVVVSRPVARITASVRTRSSAAPPRLRSRSGGRLLVVRARIRKATDAPYLGQNADLVIDGRRCRQDDRTSQVDGAEPLLDRGAATTRTFLFDLPPGAADPLARGALEFAVRTDLTAITNARSVARIRLAPEG